MKAPRHILVIALRQIGDVLVTTPLIEDAHLRWPEAKIDVLGFESSRGLFYGHPLVRAFIASPQRPKLRETWALFRRLWRQYDLALVTQASDRSYLSALLAAPTRYAVVSGNFKESWWKRCLSARTVEIDYWHQHVVTEKRRLLPEPPVRSVQLTPPIARALPVELVRWLGGENYILIHATPLGAYKRIAESTWTKVIEALTTRYRVILTGSSQPSDRTLNQALLTSLRPDRRGSVFDASGLMDFPELTGLLEGASLYIGVDTSVSHLAAAVGGPMIVLFGPTPPTNFGPWPKGFSEDQPYQLRQGIQRVGPVTLIQGPGDCVPCRKAGCDDSTVGESACLQALSFEMILPELEYYLGPMASNR